MSKTKTLLPDYYFDSFSDANPEFLNSIGVKGIVLDIDNTLEPYENPLPSDRVIAWFDSLKVYGIKAAFVSNNDSERVLLFNKNLGFPAYFKAGKPFKKNVLRALSDMNVSPDEAILMGDQIFTDIWAARNAGIRAILVPPIKDKRDVLTRTKRLLERPLIKKYKKRNNI